MSNETEAQDLGLEQLEQVVGGANEPDTGALRNTSGPYSLVGQKGALMSLGGVNTSSDITLKRGIIAI